MLVATTPSFTIATTPCPDDRRTGSSPTARHVLLPKDIEALLPKPQRLLSETEWRGIGVQQSRGWVHYAIHRPEPHMYVGGAQGSKPHNLPTACSSGARSTMASQTRLCHRRHSQMVSRHSRASD